MITTMIVVVFRFVGKKVRRHTSGHIVGVASETHGDNY